METTLDNQRQLEQLDVLNRRYDEARQAGLSPEQAISFSSSDRDIGELRRLVSLGAPSELIARIVRA